MVSREEEVRKEMELQGENTWGGGGKMRGK